jgi:hypothetical protein
MPEGKGSVPEGRSDRSQSRSACNSPPKGPSRRARHDQAQALSQRYFASKVRRVFQGRRITPIIESVRIPARFRPCPRDVTTFSQISCARSGYER